MQEIIKADKGEYKDVDLKKSEAVIAFATYGSRDRDKDIANPGMFTKSWQEFKDVRLFLNHDKTKAPGRILKLWDDNNHAYAHAKFGSSTLGQDTLKDIDEGIITDASYSFLPTKYDPLPGGGYNYKEGFHKEVSPLTHWGAHPQSKIKAVRKMWEGVQVNDEVMKELSSDEVIQLKSFIAALSGNLAGLVNLANGLQPGSDLYTWVHDMISNANSAVQSFKYRLQWYGPREKSWADINERVQKIKSYCQHSTASDEHIQELQKEADELEALLSIVSAGSTQSSPTSTQEQQKSGSIDKDVELQLLNLSMSLDGNY